MSSSAAQQEIRTQRENELAALKKTLEDESNNHEATMTAMKQKQAKAAQELNDQMEALKRVWGNAFGREALKMFTACLHASKLARNRILG